MRIIEIIKYVAFLVALVVIIIVGYFMIFVGPSKDLKSPSGETISVQMGFTDCYVEVDSKDKSKFTVLYEDEKVAEGVVIKNSVKEGKSTFEKDLIAASDTESFKEDNRDDMKIISYVDEENNQIYEYLPNNSNSIIKIKVVTGESESFSFKFVKFKVR